MTILVFEKCHYTWLGLRELLLSYDASMRIVYCNEVLEEMKQIVEKANIDAVIIGSHDLLSDVDSCFDFLHRFKARGQIKKIIMLSEFNPFYLHKLKSSGLINSIVHKQGKLCELSQDIERSMQLDSFISSHIRRMSKVVASAPDYSLLTFSEKNILTNLLLGKTLTQISTSLNRSIKTISSQKRTAMKKLGLRSTRDLVAVQEKLRLYINSQQLVSGH
ncbi:Capsular synthesis regulator component B [Serratia quinivorans]|uniref:LuxR C-terminal-related transcriptional regulator n=1 Tax=Serratia quinivorans TaxID=137545 RepID=UPI00217ABC45|nr:LuxR C-terminal-related transcriptional regulator [Serratia quinivorans]CAI1555449.1 Capsular synthesis regulator component B [Serratia quinivorans]